MDLSFHKQTLKECLQKQEHFETISFPVVAQSFANAVRALQELIDALEKLEENAGGTDL